MDPKDSFKQTKGFALRPTLVTAVICVVLLASGLVGTFAFFQSKAIINTLWTNLADLVSKAITERTLGFLRPAIAFLNFSVQLENEKTISKISKGQPNTLLEYCYAAVQTNPDVAGVSFSFPSGDFIGAYRGEEQDEITLTLRDYLGETTQGQAKTRIRNFRVGEEGKPILIEDYLGSYDPRTRPFWKTGIESPEGGWTLPYAFWTGDETGVAYAKPQISQGTFSGMWAVKYRLKKLSDYLSSLKKTYTGPIALFSDQGVLIATSEGNPPIYDPSNPSKKLQQLMSAKLFYEQPKIQLLIRAWKHATLSSNPSSLFHYGPYLGDLTSFPKNSNIPWNILTLMPEKELFAPVIDQAWHNFFIALSLCFLCILAAAIFFGHISKKLKEIAYEMHKIKYFNFSDRLLSKSPSFVKEINMMNHSTDSLKVGVQSFAKYVPVQQVQDLINSGHAATLGGNKQELTMLFTDLESFTSLAEQIPPKELVEILEQYLTSMSDVIISLKGTVDKYVGDSIVSFWGAPKPMKDHAQCACRSALIMKKNLLLLWKKWEKENKPLLRQRIGINTGTVIVGNIGSPTRMDYTVIGDQVNLASRLEGLNKIYGTDILIGETTAKLVETQFLIRPVDWVAVSGKKEGGLIHELIDFIDHASERQTNAIHMYKTALYMYKNRQFTEASQGFDQANELFGGNDGPSKVLREKCRQFAVSPPPDDWTGFTFIKDK